MFENNRILVVDDNELIHEDFKKILLSNDINKQDNNYIDLEKELFGMTTSSNLTIPAINYCIDFAFQGQDAYEMAKKADKKNKPYALIFMDVRMPPGWDGIETISKIWEKYPNTEVVICSAYSDYSWDKIIEKLGTNDRLIFLKKPFDAIEVKQLALTLVKKWNLYEKSKNYVSDLEREVTKRTRQLKGMVQELLVSRDKLKQEVFIRQNAENELSLERDNLRYLLKNIPDAVLTINAQGEIKLINNSFEKILNKQENEIINRNINDILFLYDNENNRILYKNFVDSKCNNSLLKLEIDNIIKTVIVSCARIYQNTLVILIKNITEKIKTEEELIKARNLESVTSFAGGLANDFEHIISGIIGNITLAKNIIGENSKAKEYLDTAESDSIKVSILSQQLQNFSKNNSIYNNNKTIKNKQISIISSENSIKKALENTLKNLGYLVVFENSRESSIIFLDEDNLSQINDLKNSRVILVSIYDKKLCEEKYLNLNFIDVLETPFKLKDIEIILKNNL